jgi:hypothetical protein
LPIEWGEGQYWQGEFLGLVGEMQKASIESPLAGGKAGRYASLDPFLEHKAGTLERNLSPSARVMPNVVYSCTTNLKLWVDTILQKQAEALKSGKPVDRSITVGGKMYDIKTQQWLDAPGQIMFTSPDAAFNYLFEITGGKIPKDAGIVAIRIAGKDIGTVVSPASRITYDVARKGIIKKEFVAKAKVLDEMTIQRNTKLYATKPNEFSKGGISIGEIGETWTYEPRTMQRIPVVWLATKAASDAGYGAPSLAKIRIMNRMAIWNSVVNLLDPHLPKKISVKWESAKELPSEGFVQFYREKWRWQGKEGNTLREFVAKENDVYINEIKRTIKREDYKTSTEYDSAILDRIAKDMANDYKRVADDSKVREVLRDKGELERFNNEYVISLKKLAQDLVPKVVQQTPEEIEAGLQAAIDKALVDMKKEALKERKGIIETGKEDIVGKERIEEVPSGKAPEELPEKPPGETEVIEVPPEEPTIEELIEEPPEEIPPEEPEETPMEETPITETPTELLEETAIVKTPSSEVPPIIPLIMEGGKAERRLGAYEGAIGWQQGELKSGKVFHIYKKPWEQKDYEIVVADKPPEGMRLFPSATKAIETLQVLTGEFPGERDIDIGAFQLQIKGTRQLKGRYVRRGGNTPMADVSAKEAKVTVVS